MCWETWISRNEFDYNNYDDLFDYMTETYNIDSKCRKQEIVDMKQFLVKWAANNMSKFKRYRNYSLIAKRLDLHHSSVNYLLSHRAPSYSYNKNVKHLAEIISKSYICI
jgi:hypothetical protein